MTFHTDDIPAINILGNLSKTNWQLWEDILQNGTQYEVQELESVQNTLKRLVESENSTQSNHEQIKNVLLQVDDLL